LHEELAVDHLFHRLRHARGARRAQLARRDLDAVHARDELSLRAIGRGALAAGGGESQGDGDERSHAQ